MSEGSIAREEEERVPGEIPFRLIAVVGDPERLDYAPGVAAAHPNLEFGLMLRDPEHRQEKVRLLGDEALRRTLPENIRLISNGCAIEGIAWRHLTGAELRAGIAPSGPFGCSVHSLPEIAAAEKLHPRYLLLSPVFPTDSKPGAATLGPDTLREYVAASSVPVIALGGIVTPEHVALCLDAGAAGVAGISLFEPKNGMLLEKILDLMGERLTHC